MSKRWTVWLAVVVCLGAAAGCEKPSYGGAGTEASALLAAGDPAAAEREVKRALRDAPDDPELRLLLARVYLEGGDGPAAFAAFERARVAGADTVEVREGLARSLVLQGRHAEALRYLGTAGGEDVPERLLELRLAALLKVPLARPADLFDDARDLLASGYDAAFLDALAGEEGNVPANASVVRRVIAYSSCRSPAAAAPDVLADAPGWADLREEGRRVLSVGPGRELATPSAAARIARDGDIVEIAAGTYAGDVATWTARGLWLRASGGPAVLDSGGRVAEDMGIWVIRGDDTIVEGIRFIGARASHRNGSGIRFLAHNLLVRQSEFHNNETGMLAAGRPESEIVVERSVFTENGAGDGLSHNIYIGRNSRLIFRFNFSSGARIGHELKSRAYENYVLYNRLTDGAGGTSSYTIDLPEGGFALILGNEIQQGPLTVNKHMVSLGAEQLGDREHEFIFAYNTFYNHSSPATFIHDATGAGIALVNNVFAGAPANIDAATPIRAGNAFSATGSLAGQDEGDFGLAPSARFIDAGDAMETVGDVSIVPAFEYLHPAGGRPRQTVWRRDPGAHEFCGWPETAR